MNAPDLSIVIPAYNEAARLGGTLRQIEEFFARRGDACELIVVDDGSTDDTAACVQDRPQVTAQRLDVHVIRTPVNRGKGHAVRCGVLAATGRRILMCDADLSTPIAELARLEPWLDRGFDVAIASRDLPDSRLDPPQPATRRWAAWAFRALRRRWLSPQIRDTQCGFKLFNATAAREIFARATVAGWLFDCEVLGLAERLGYRIREVGVVWRNHPDSRVRAWRVAATALPGLLAIRLRLRRISPHAAPPRRACGSD